MSQGKLYFTTAFWVYHKPELMELVREFIGKNKYFVDKGKIDTFLLLDHSEFTSKKGNTYRLDFDAFFDGFNRVYFIRSLSVQLPSGKFEAHKLYR